MLTREPGVSAFGRRGRCPIPERPMGEPSAHRLRADDQRNVSSHGVVQLNASHSQRDVRLDDVQPGLQARSLRFNQFKRRGAAELVELLSRLVRSFGSDSGSFCCDHGELGFAQRAVGRQDFEPQRILEGLTLGHHLSSLSTRLLGIRVGRSKVVERPCQTHADVPGGIPFISNRKDPLVGVGIGDVTERLDHRQPLRILHLNGLL